ncbi:MAG: Mur ligase family protein [Clostridiaceae bacterium]|nr:Mur ligase family protein [Clostridiaceae bacterium]
MKRIIKLLRLYTALFIGKLAIYVCRIAGSGGTSFPGRIAMKIYPEILRTIGSGYRIIMITGTNGKTTTARIIEQILRENHIKYVANKSGANLVSGLVTTLISDVRLKGTPSSPTALLEVDEAAFKVASKYVHPAVLVVTNFFRDQLDRYGELFSAVESVKEGILNSPDTTLVLNGDDSLCASLGRDVKNPVIYYGMDNIPGFEEENGINLNNDASYCLFCKNKYEYLYRTYSHLGSYKCPGCGFQRPEPLVHISRVPAMTGEFTTAVINTPSGNFEANINLPGFYNIYNALAAVTFAEVLGFSHDKTVKALACFESGFGRMESIPVDDKNIQVILIKNPTGLSQVLKYLSTVDRPFVICFMINDNTADGTDISWLYDVDFEPLKNMQNMIRRIFASGIRAEDMAVRLKYAGIFTDNIVIEKNNPAMLDAALNTLNAGETLFILPTYTALLDIRKLLKKRFDLKNFWQ